MQLGAEECWRGEETHVEFFFGGGRAGGEEDIGNIM